MRKPEPRNSGAFLCASHAHIKESLSVVSQDNPLALGRHSCATGSHLKGNLMGNTKTTSCVNVETGPLSAALKARMPMGCDVFEIVKLVEAEMHGQPLNAKTVYTFTEEVRKRIADLIVIEIDELGILSNAETNCHPDSAVGKVYEAIFELDDGKKILGYSDQDEPSMNGGFYHCSANKDLEGRVAVKAKYVSNFRFTPI